MSSMCVFVNGWSIHEVSLCPYSNPAESNKVAEASRVFVKEMAAPALERRIGILVVPPDILPVYTLHVQIMYFFGNVYKNAMVSERYRSITRLRWSEK